MLSIWSLACRALPCRFITRTVIILLFTILGASVTAHAQTAHAGATVVVGSGFSSPYGVAVDKNGNVFVADPNNSTLKEIVAGSNGNPTGVVSSTSTVLTLGSSGNFFFPFGVAVDGNGNVFVADTSNNLVKEIVAGTNGDPAGVVSSTSTVITLGSSFSFNQPHGVAVDGSGNVFIADTGNNLVKEIVAGSNGNPAGMVSSTSMVITLSGSFNFSQPFGVAVDRNGNAFVADNGDGTIQKIVAGTGGNLAGVVGATSTVQQVVSGISGSAGVSMDRSGNLFVGDIGNNAVYEKVAISGDVELLSGGFNSPQGVAVDGGGNVFVGDYANGEVKEIVAGALKFPATAVGSASEVRTVYFTFDTAGTLASAPSGPYAVLAQGKPEADFQAATTQGPNACVAGTNYAAGAVCTVDVTFSPAVPQQRVGSAQLIGSAGSPIATFQLYGRGTGPLVAFPPGVQLSLPDLGFGGAGVAVDGNGNVFVGDCYGLFNPPYTNGMAEYVAGTGGNPPGMVSSSSTVKVVGSGFFNPCAVAVDGSGNVFVGDGNGFAKEIVAGTGGNLPGAVSSSSTVVQLAGTYSDPQGIAVDKSGNVFIVNGSAVQEIVAGTGGNLPGMVSASSTVITVGGGFASLGGIGVDGNGNVVVADSGNNAVKEIVAGTGGNPPGMVSSTSTVNTLFTADPDDFVYGATADSRGNVYVADTGASMVKEIVAGTGGNPPGVVSSSSTVIPLSGDGGQPGSLATDGSGNVFVVNYGGETAYEIAVGIAPSLTFTARTAVGSTSTDSPKTVMLQNLGNEVLSLPVPASGDNPNILSPSFTLDNNSAGTCPLTTSNSATMGSVAAESICNLPVSFTPTIAGPISSSLVLTDNNLNANPSTTQTILLSGIGVDITLSPTSLPGSSVGQSYVPATITASGGTGPYTFTVTSGSLPSGLALSPGGVLSGMPDTAGSYTFAVTATDSDPAGPFTGTQSYTIVIVGAPTTTTVTSSLNPSTFGQSVTFTATITSATTGAVNGTAMFYDGGVSIGMGTVTNGIAAYNTTMLPVGTHPITTVFTPASGSNFATSTSAAINQVVNAASSTTTVTSSLNPSTFGQSVTFTATITSATTGAVNGTAMFYDNGASLGTAAVTNGAATLPATSTLTVGTHPITAMFIPASGSSFVPSTSAAINQVVNAAVSQLDFTFTLIGTGYQTVIPGSSVSYNFALAPIGGGYPGAVTFKIAGCPSRATCSIAPVMVGATAGPQSEVLVVQTALALTASNHASPFGRRGAPIALACLLMPLLFRRRMRARIGSGLFMLLLLLGGVAAAGALAGCGTGNGFFGQAPSNAVITVTANSGGSSHSAQVTINIQ